MPHCTLRPSFLLFVLALGCSGGGGDEAPVAAATIAPDGGAFEITAGKLAGVRVEIPPGAVVHPIRVTAAEARPSAHPGFRSISRAVYLRPDTDFLLPVLVTLPFPAAALSSNETVILQRSPTGAIVEIAPDVVDPAGLATFATRSLSTVWVAERLFLGVATEEFLSLEDGNTWTFENGLAATITMAFTEPNFGGMPVWRLQLDGPQQSLGLYLERHWSGATNLLGICSTDGNGFQQLHDAALLLPGHCTIGQGMLDAFPFTSYEPFGSETAANTGTTVVHMLPRQPTHLDTPVGEYTDLLRFDVVMTHWAPSGQATGSTTLGLTFARYVGLVAVEAFGLAGGLTGGMVGGVPIGP